MPLQSDLVVDGTRRQVGSPSHHFNEGDENGDDEQDEKKGESLSKKARTKPTLTEIKEYNFWRPLWNI